MKACNINLDNDSKLKIENFSIQLAEEALKSFTPDVFHTPKQAYSEAKEQFEQWSMDFLELMFTGCKSLAEALAQLYPQEYSTPEAFNIPCSHLLKASLDLHANAQQKLAICDVCQVKEEQFPRLNQAAALLFEQQQFAKAAAAYALLSFLKSNEPAYWQGYGNASYFNRDFKAALRAYNKLHTLSAGDIPCYFYAAHCYRHLGQIDQALAKLDQALEVIQQNPDLQGWYDRTESLKRFFIQLPRSQL